MPQTRRSNNSEPAGIFIPELPVDADPRLAESIRLLYSYVEEQQSEIKQMRGVQVPTDPAALASLRAAILTADRVPSVAEITGLLAQPQRARVPILDTLPDTAFAQEGEIVSVDGVLYIFVAPGTWTILTTVGVVLRDTHANRVANFPPADYPVGTLFWETDRTVMYQRALNGSAVADWIYTFGTMFGQILSASTRPTDLGTDAQDVGFTFYANDVIMAYRWSGSGWVYSYGVGLVKQTVTANTLIADPNFIPANAPFPGGSIFDYIFTQDGTGGWVVTWDPVFNGPTSLTVGGVATGINTVKFRALSTGNIVMESNTSDIL